MKILHIGLTESIWSDFTGTGSALTDYTNGAAETTTALNMDLAWKTGASFGDPCVQMKSDANFALEPTDCSGPAKYICMKSVCPDGFQWYDMRTCVKTMDTPASKVVQIR